MKWERRLKRVEWRSFKIKYWYQTAITTCFAIPFHQQSSSRWIKDKGRPNAGGQCLLAICRTSGCTVVSGVVVVGSVCNRSQMTTSKCTLNFWCEYRSWPWLEMHKRNFWQVKIQGHSWHIADHLWMASSNFLLVLWHCWLSNRKGIGPVTKSATITSKGSLLEKCNKR